MKRIITLLAVFFLTVSAFAQAPQKMSYQAIIRNSAGKLVASTTIGMRISILKGSVVGTAVYIETQTQTTNVNGLATLEIGSGSTVTGTFSAIDWSAGPFFIKTETDPAGGTAYTISGTSELLSVPYALYAANGAAAHYIGESYGGGIVFYVYDGGQHGLIASTIDQSSAISWYNGSYTTTDAIRDGVNAGQINTERIITNQGSGWYAAEYCSNYKGGGFGDWYLPSKSEMTLMFQHADVIPGLSSSPAPYWCSNESDAVNAWICGGGDPQAGDKFYHQPVRAIRAF